MECPTPGIKYFIVHSTLFFPFAYNCMRILIYLYTYICTICDMYTQTLTFWFKYLKFRNILLSLITKKEMEFRNKNKIKLVKIYK